MDTEQLCREGLGVSGGKAQHEPAVCTWEPGGPIVSLHEKRGDQQVKESDSAPLLCSWKTPPGVMNPVLGAPAQGRHGVVGAAPEEVHEDDQRAGASLS